MNNQEEIVTLINDIKKLESIGDRIKSGFTYHGRGEGLRSEYVAWSGIRKAILGLEALIRDKAQVAPIDEGCLNMDTRSKYKEIVSKAPAVRLKRQKR